MSSIFGARPQSQTQNRYTGVDVQTSAQGAVIPIVYGANRIGTNLIYLSDFQAHSTGGGKGGKGGGGKGSGGYDYTCALDLGLCEGPIQNIGTVWHNSAVTTLGSLDLTLYTGTASQGIPAWMTANDASHALAYSQTAHLFSSYYDLGASPSVPLHNFEVIGFYSGSVSGTPDVNMGDVIPDFITNAQYGLDPSASYIDSTSLANYKTYCFCQDILLSPALTTQEQATSIIARWALLTNSWIFWNGTQLVFAPLGDQVLVNSGTTYDPVLTPVYNLGLDDFIFDPSSEAPVTVTRIDPADGYNNVQLDTRLRQNAYNANPLRYDDQTSEDQYGVLQSQVIQADEICDAGVGAIVAQLIGKRSVYIRNSYEWQGGYGLVLLEPGDIVSLTEPGIGLSAQPVRITSVAESDKQILKFTAEEFPGAIGSAHTVSPQGSGAASGPNLMADPGSVNTPLIFEPGPSFTNGQAQVWIGASGGANWGGADIWISTDATNYAYIGTLDGPIAQGTLTANLANHADPDSVDTLSVNMTESGVALSTAVTHANADAFQTASLIDNEIVAYGTVTLTGALTYNLTYLRRGGYNTTPASHSSGAQFWGINPAAVFQYPLPAQYVGVPLYFKFTSFNTFGNAMQSIAAVTQYSYTPNGIAFTIAAPTGLSLTSSRTTQTDGTTFLTMTAAWTASAGPLLGGYEVEWSVNGGTSWSASASYGATAVAATLTPATPGTSYAVRVRAIGQNGLAVSAWDTSGAVSSGNLLAAVPSAPVSVTATAGPAAASISWSMPAPDYSVSAFAIYRAAGSGASFGSASQVATVAASPWVDTGVAGGTAYTWFVEAINAQGASSASSGASCTTLSATPGSLPTSLPSGTGVWWNNGGAVSIS